MAVPYPDWLFDDSPIPDPMGWGERAVQFIKGLKHPKSTLPGKAFPLYPWQERLIRRIYGPVKTLPNGQLVRQVSTVYLQMGRGGRKTTLAAALSSLHVFGPERRTKGQNITAAADTEQARIAFNELKDICEATPWLGTDKRKIHIQDSENRLTHVLSGSTFQVLSSDVGSKHGATPIFALVDELHAHQATKKGTLYDVIRTGMNKVDGSLMFIATTAGVGDQGPDYPVYKQAARIQSGEINSESFLPVIFEAPADCDWRDEEVWAKYNPGLIYGFPSLQGMRDYAEQIAEFPAKIEVFKQLHLGIRAAYSSSPFIDMAVYDECGQPVDLEAHEHFQDPCWIAVDVGVSQDLTAIVACWPDGQGGCDLWAWFPIPEDSIRKRTENDKVPYQQWVDQEFMQPTPGNVTSDPDVADMLRDLCARFNVQEIIFDPAYARGIFQPLQDEGLPVVIMSQDWRHMAPATKQLEKMLVGRKLSHGGHPVLRWNFSNIATVRDRNENILFHKGKSRDRIDGAVAAAMAVGRAFENEARPVQTKPFWTEEDFDPSDVLGLTPEGDAASEAEEDAKMQAELREMLGLD